MTPPVDAIVARLTALHPKRIDLSLDRVQRLLAALDHPERKLPPVIHVAGTNGKGSTIAFLRAILEAAGKRVHVYTSPHLVRFNERFRLGAAGRRASWCPTQSLSPTLEECERANAGAPITVFEITTAVGLLLFARHPADVLLLEVGLGGRLDATNVVDHPLATVITRIAIDHTDFLGDTLEKIANEKAGILKRGTPAIVAAQARDALAVIERQAARLNAPLKIAGEDWTATEERGRLVYQDEAGLLDLPAPKLYGRHQFENAGPRHRGAARDQAVQDFAGRLRGRHGQGRLAGAAAAAWRRAGWSNWRPPAASCGSTAATIPTAAAPSRRRSPISRSASRGRWC